jgi:hypothetical protein
LHLPTRLRSAERPGLIVSSCRGGLLTAQSLRRRPRARTPRAREARRRNHCFTSSTSSAEFERAISIRRTRRRDASEGCPRRILREAERNRPCCETMMP